MSIVSYQDIVTPQAFPYFEGMPGAVGTLIGFGDSNIAGTISDAGGGFNASNRMINIVAAALGATLTNAGIGGTTIQNGLVSGAALANNGRDRYVATLLGASKCDLVVIGYGSNDARYIGTPSTMNLANFENDLTEVVKGLIGGGYPRNRICLNTPNYITDSGLLSGSTGFAGQTRAGYEAFVRVVIRVARRLGVMCADVYNAIKNAGGAVFIGPDDLHLTKAGHALAAATILAALRIPVTVPTDYDAYFVHDDFTDSDGTRLSAHSGEKMGLWSVQFGNTPAGAPILYGGRVYSRDTQSVYQAAGVPVSGDYEVDMFLDCISELTADNIAAMVRAQPSAQTYYWGGYSRTAGGWRLFKTINGTPTQIGSTYSATFAAGTSKKLTLRVVGSALTLLVDDVVRCSGTDTAIPGATPGKSGMRLNIVADQTLGIHTSKFRAKDL